MNFNNIIKVSIVEDNIELSNAWRDTINKNKNTTCLGTYPSAEIAEIEIVKNIPDVILMDIGLPSKDGIKLTEELKIKFTKLEVLICTVFHDTDKIIAALKAGASGYVLKDISKDELIQAIQTIYRGESAIDTQIARKIISQFQPTKKDESIEALTEREEEILKYVAKGYRNKEIAEIFFISVNTVRTHIRNIYSKLQVNNRTGAVNEYFGKRNI